VKQIVVATLLVLAIMIEPGCKQAQAPTDPKAELVAAMHHYDELVGAMDSKAITGLFTSDGSIANGGQVMATTPADIFGFLASFEGKVRIEATASTVEHVRLDGTHGFVDGTFAQTARIVATDKVVKVSGRFDAEWIREAAGWRLRKMQTTPTPAEHP